MLKEEKVLGVKINTGLTMSKVLDLVDTVFLKDGKTHYICTTNPEFIVDSQKDSEFRSIVNAADLSIPDGSGVLFALEYKRRLEKYIKIKNSKTIWHSIYPVLAFYEGVSLGLLNILGLTDIGERISGVQLTYKLCELSAQKKYSVFLLGGRPKDFWGRAILNGPDLATTAADVLRKSYPNVHIIGSTSRFSRNVSDDASTVSYIRDCMQKHGVDRVDLLLVAYNHSWQEKWIKRNAAKIPAAVSVGVGGTFDDVAGITKLSPDIVRKKNLSWLYRMLIQPWRFTRIAKAFPIFPLKVYFDTISH